MNHPAPSRRPHRPTFRALLFAVASISIAVASFGETKSVTTLVVDLAHIPPGDPIERTVPHNAEYSVTLVSMVPGKSYAPSLTIDEQEIGSLVFPGSSSEGSQAKPASRPGGEEDSCVDVILELFEPTTQESEVPILREKVRSSPPSACSSHDAGSIFEQLTSLELEGPWRLKRGQCLVVTTKRAGSSQGERVARYCTEPWGEWRTSYGFTFVPNQDETYFSQPINDGKFKIAEETDREDFDFAPSVLFHFQRLGSNHSAIAGLGHDLDNVMVFLGYGYTIWENVTLTAGIAMHEQERLAGKYDAMQVLEEALDSGQLNEPTYNANAYVGVSFRFDRDIHAERNRLIAEKKKAQAAAAASAAAAEKAKTEAQAAKAQRLALCLAQAEVAHKEALAALADDDGTADLTTAAELAVAEAKHALAKVVCEGDPAGKEKAKDDLQAAELKLQSAKKLEACLEVATATREAAAAKCVVEHKDHKDKEHQCIADAKKAEADAKKACLDPPPTD